MPAPIPTLMQSPFIGGLTEGKDDRSTDPQDLIAADNVVYLGGALGKRYGYDRESLVDLAGNNIPSPIRCYAYRNEFVVTDGLGIYSRTNGQYSRVDAASPATVTREPVAGQANSVQSFDTGYLGTGATIYKIHLFEGFYPNGNTAIFVTVTDNVTGAVLLSDAIVAVSSSFNYIAPKLTILPNAGRAYITYFRSGTGTLYGRYIDVTAPQTLSAETAVLTGLSTSNVGAYGITALVGGSPSTDFLIFVQELVSAANAIGVWKLDRNWGVANVSGSLRIPGGAGGGAKAYALAIVNTTNVVCAYVEPGASGAVRAFAVSTNVLGLTMNDFQVYSAPAPIVPPGIWKAAVTALPAQGATTAIVTVGQSIDDAGTYNCKLMSQCQFTLAQGTPVPVRSMYNVQMVSEPFVYGGRLYCVVRDGNDGSYTASTFVVDMEVASTAPTIIWRPVAIVAARISNSSNHSLGLVAAHVMPLPGSTTKFLAACEVAAANYAASQLHELIIDFGYSNHMQGAVLGDALYMGGGLPSVYDGRKQMEMAFCSSPIITVANGGAGAIPAGDYFYKAVYEFRDNRGQVYRSIASPAVKITLAGASSVNVTVPYLHLTTKQQYANGNAPYITIALFRTALLQPDVYYRVFKEGGATTLANINLVNFPELKQSVINDNVADVTATGYGLLYTTGNILDNEIPPSLQGIVAHKNRLWGIGDDRRTIWYSKTFVAGESPGWHEILSFTVDDDGLPVRALASMDNMLVIFKDRAVYVVTGDGPADSGVGSDLSTPERVNNDAGCIEPRSIVRIPNGLLFQSYRGIELLGRGLEATFAGLRCSTTTANYPNIVGASQNEIDGHAIFLLTNGANSKILVYDYLYDLWSTWTLFGAPLLSSIVKDNTGVLRFVGSGSPAGFTYSQNRTLKRDWTNWVPYNITSAIFRPAGLLGFSRISSVSLNGKYIGQHNLVLSLKLDYGSAVDGGTPKTWVDAVLSTLTPYQLSVIPTRQEAVAASLTIQDTEVVANAIGDSASFNGIALQVAAESGTMRLPPVAQQ